jgi:hypothetical protein
MTLGKQLAVALFAGALAGGTAGTIGALGAIAIVKSLEKDGASESSAGEENEAAASATTPGELRVLSQPAGAAVTLDGTSSGATPLDLDAPAGIHTVAFALDGYAAHAVDVSLDPGETMTLSVALTAAPEEAETGPAERVGGGGGRRRFAMPRRDCDAESRECDNACDSAQFSCWSSCQYCGSCVTSMTWEECNRICNTCRQGCEQNELFCNRQCEGQAAACRASQ